MRFNFSILFQTHNLLVKYLASYRCATRIYKFFISDIGYQTKVYSDIRYDVRLCALQSDIGHSDIRLSSISLITDIGMSAHL